MKIKNKILRFLTSNNIPLDIFEIYCFSIENPEDVEVLYHDINVYETKPSVNLFPAIGNRELNIEFIFDVDKDEVWVKQNVYNYKSTLKDNMTGNINTVKSIATRFKLKEFLS